MPKKKKQDPLTTSSATVAVPDTAKPQPAIALRNVGKSYRVGKNDITVLKDINLEIFPGEFVIILGPSGSGKSTLLNHLLGLEQPTSGRVILYGHDITNLGTNAIARLRYRYCGVIFQRPDWINSINVVQNVSLPLAIHGVRTGDRLSKAWQYLKEVDMTDHGSYPPTDLSGGQQQKIALARAMINEPSMYIADEPTGNLDSVSADKVMDIFQHLNQDQKKTIIMVTHNIDYVRFGSRTVYIRDGQVASGAEQFLKTPAEIHAA
ncbi:MAG: ABC transporter ATP-binding protein [Patescibacteria group bacterium]